MAFLFVRGELAQVTITVAQSINLSGLLPL